MTALYRRSQIAPLALAAGLALSAASARAAIINDAAGEEFSGNNNLDIHSVEVTNDANNLRFKINLVGNPAQTNWGKYMVGIDSVDGGDTAGNGWARPISMSSGMDYWIGSWADSGTGDQLWRFAQTWILDRNSGNEDHPLPLPVVNSDSIILTVPLSALGLTTGSTFDFDVYTAGGGNNDSANDALSNPNQSTSGWSGPYDSGSLVSSYTVVVPEPGALGGMILAGAAALRRRR